MIHQGLEFSGEHVLHQGFETAAVGSQQSCRSAVVRHDRMAKVWENFRRAPPTMWNHQIQDGGGFEAPHAHPSGSGIERGDPEFEFSFAHWSTLGAKRVYQRFESTYAHLSEEGSEQGYQGFESLHTSHWIKIT